MANKISTYTHKCAQASIISLQRLLVPIGAEQSDMPIVVLEPRSNEPIDRKGVSPPTARFRKTDSKTPGHSQHLLSTSNHASILIRDEMGENGPETCAKDSKQDVGSFVVLSKHSSVSRPLTNSNSRESGLVLRPKVCPLSLTLTQQN